MFSRCLCWLFVAASMTATSAEAQEPVCKIASTCAALLLRGEDGALHQLRTLGDGGDAEAQVWLGLYFRGKLQSTNQLSDESGAEGMKWLQLAAGQGDPKGLYYLAREEQTNQAEQFKLYRLAAELGHSASQLQLAVFYLNGLVVERDLVLFLEWARLGMRDQEGAARESQEAWVAESTQEMTAEQIAAAERLAREWKPKTWTELQANETP